MKIKHFARVALLLFSAKRFFLIAFCFCNPISFFQSHLLKVQTEFNAVTHKKRRLKSFKVKKNFLVLSVKLFSLWR